MNKSTNYDYLTVFTWRQRCLGENVVVWWVFIYPVAMHRPCGHVCAWKNKSHTTYVTWLLQQQTTPTPTNNSDNNNSTSTTMTTAHHDHHNLRSHGHHHMHCYSFPIYALQWCLHHIATTNESTQCAQTMTSIVWMQVHLLFFLSFFY